MDCWLQSQLRLFLNALAVVGGGYITHCTTKQLSFHFGAGSVGGSFSGCLGVRGSCCPCSELQLCLLDHLYAIKISLLLFTAPPILQC